MEDIIRERMINWGRINFLWLHVPILNIDKNYIGGNNFSISKSPFEIEINNRRQGLKIEKLNSFYRISYYYSDISIWEKDFDKELNLKSETFYSFYMKDSIIKRYYKNGNVKDVISKGRREEYDNEGFLIKRSIFNTRDQILEEFDRKSKTLQISKGSLFQIYHIPNEKILNDRILLLERIFIDSNQIKIYEWYENGQIHKEKYFINNKKAGKWKIFYPNGRLKIQKEYYDDKRDGHWFKLNLNGELIIENFYHLGNNISREDYQRMNSDSDEDEDEDEMN